MSSTAAAYVRSDPGLLVDIRRYGKFDSNACYQCGSCTVSCELVEGAVNFPRRSIRYALLGLRRPLVGSLEPWICHDCGDCSIACPRQADPRASMATLRRFLSAQYDWTRIAGGLLRSRVAYLAAFVVVLLLAVGLLLWYHLWYVEFPLSEFVRTPLGLDHMFPIIGHYTRVVMLLPLLLVVSRVFRIWRLTMESTRIPASIYAAEAWRYVYHSVTHSLMRKCPERGRWLGHWMLAAGTMTMLAVKVFALRWFQTDALYPFYHPQRWVGYVAAGLILYGLGDILVGRIRAQKEFYKETRLADMVFPVLLLLTVLTGLAAHVFRYTGLGMACHFTYAAHVIIATPMLVVEMSFGKWAHMVYRPFALYLQAVRDRAVQPAPAKEALGYAG